MHSVLTRIVLPILAITIILGPGLVQVFGVDLPLFRPWQMYSTVGVGAPNGAFRIRDGNQPVREISITEALELEHIRELQPYPGSGDIEQSFLDRAALIETAQRLCRELPQDQRLEFEGRVAGRHAWQPVALDHAQLCPES